MWRYILVAQQRLLKVGDLITCCNFSYNGLENIQKSK